MAYNTFKLSNFLNIIYNLKTAVYFQLDPTDYDGNTDSSITHVCELILT